MCVCVWALRDYSFLFGPARGEGTRVFLARIKNSLLIDILESGSRKKGKEGASTAVAARGTKEHRNETTKIHTFYVKVIR